MTCGHTNMAAVHPVEIGKDGDTTERKRHKQRRAIQHVGNCIFFVELKITQSNSSLYVILFIVVIIL